MVEPVQELGLVHHRTAARKRGRELDHDLGAAVVAVDDATLAPVVHEFRSGEVAHTRRVLEVWRAHFVEQERIATATGDARHRCTPRFVKELCMEVRSLASVAHRDTVTVQDANDAVERCACIAPRVCIDATEEGK